MRAVREAVERAGCGPFDTTGAHAWLPPVTTGLVWVYEPTAANVVAAAGGSIVDGGKVSRILDTSGNGNHTQTQGSGTAQATWVASSIAGRPALRFNGSANYFASAAVNLDQPTTVFIVYSRIGAQGTKFIFDSIDATARQTYLTNNATAVNMYWESTSAAVQLIVSRVVSTSGELAALQYNGASTFIRLNASQTNLSGTPAAAKTGVNGMTIGARYSGTLCFSGDISLILQYRGALSGANVASIESATRTRWSGLY